MPIWARADTGLGADSGGIPTGVAVGALTFESAATAADFDVEGSKVESSAASGYELLRASIVLADFFFYDPCADTCTHYVYAEEDGSQVVAPPPLGSGEKCASGDPSLRYAAKYGTTSSHLGNLISFSSIAKIMRITLCILRS